MKQKYHNENMFTGVSENVETYYNKNKITLLSTTFSDDSPT